MPGLHRTTDIHRIGPFFHAMRLGLQQLSPTAHEAPRVVLLTPGALSETAFDQAFLSSLLGFPLVEGADLVVRDGRVWQRSIGRLEPVYVILRRVDGRGDVMETENRMVHGRSTIPRREATTKRR